MDIPEQKNAPDTGEKPVKKPEKPAERPEQPADGAQPQRQQQTAAEAQNAPQTADTTQEEEYRFYEDYGYDENPYFVMRSPLKKKHVLTILFSGLFLVVLVTYFIFGQAEEFSAQEPIYIVGERSNMGIHSPSVVQEPKASWIWMAYASIAKFSGDDEPKIDINIASSIAGGGRWQHEHTAFKSRTGILYVDSDPDSLGAEVSGYWRYETPSLVYDPKDVGREWKIYAYRYFWTGDINSAKKYSAIVYRYTDLIGLGEWSNEQWLLSASTQQPPAPYSNLVKQHLNEMSPDLADIGYYSQPSVLYTPSLDLLLMTLTAYSQDNKPNRIILLASTDHGVKWGYLGTIIKTEDAGKFGKYTRVDSGSLFEQDGQIYFMASFGDDRIEHQGTHVFKFADVAVAQLQNDKKGRPKVIQFFPPIEEGTLGKLGAGQSAYIPQLTKSGLLMSHMKLTDDGRPFQIYRTNTLVEEKHGFFSR